MHGELLRWSVRGAGFAVGVGVVAGLVLFAGGASRVLLLVFVAILLASALEPFVGWIRGHVGIGRGATILLVYAAFFAAVIALAFVIVPAAIAQFNDIIAGLPPVLDQARDWAADLRPRGLSASVTAIVDAIEDATAPETPDPDAVLEVGLTVAEAIASVATVLAIVFFWLVEHARLQRFALAFVPAHRRAGARDAWNEIEARLGMWVRGQLILMAAIGAATGVANFLLGVPSAMLLALIAALTEAIPIIGPLLGAIPAVLVAFTVSPQLALVVALVYIVLQFIEGNVLVPLVMRNTIGLSPFLVIVSVLIGGSIGGLIGALFAVPIAAAVLVVLERLQARETPVAQDPASTANPDATETAGFERSLPDAGASGPG
jgi:predicted PurR-regulated permease PerM